MRARTLWYVAVTFVVAACSSGGDNDDSPASNPVPTVTSVAPATASAGGAAFTLTVNGTNFTAGSVVQWNGSSRTTTFVSASQITAAITAGDIAATGSASVTVNNPAPGGGTSNSNAVTIGHAAPTISALVPATVTAAGTNFVLTVNGAGFVNGAVIKWNGADRTTTFVSSSALQAPIAASDIALASVVPITVTNPGVGSGTSSAASLTVTNPAPVISSTSPTLVAPGGAAFDLTVDGTGFVSTSVVRWGGSNRTTTFVNSTRLTAAIPASDIVNQSVVQISVVNVAPGGGTSNAVDFFVGNPVPVISSLVPVVVRPGSSGVTLRVLGSSFVNGATVRLDNVEVQTTFVNGGELEASIPTQDLVAQRLAPIIVRNPAPGGGFSNEAILTVAPYGATARISVPNGGGEANDDSDHPTSSADGRFVAFTSVATNLVAGDTNAAQDVFVRDTCQGASGCTPSTTRISIADNSSEANAASDTPSISADGRFVAFTSVATNLVTGDSNGVQDIFVRDTCVGAAGCVPSTTRVSVASDGSQGDVLSSNPSINASGRYVAFVTPSILVLGDVNQLPDAFVRDTCAGAPAGCVPATSRVVVDIGRPGDQGVFGVAIGADGRFVAFKSHARTQGANITAYLLYVFDTCTGAAAGCSAGAVLAQEFATSTGSLELYDRALSNDGRFVASKIIKLTEEETHLADSCIGAPAGCTPSAMVISPGAGQNSNPQPSAPALTPDGRFVSFATRVFRSGGLPEIFAVVHDTCRGAPSGCVPGAVRISEAADGTWPDGPSGSASLEANGAGGAFASDATNQVPGDTNGSRDIFRALTGYILR
jgi:hypothetical protein